jgi:PAS domain S-box-containing protein
MSVKEFFNRISVFHTSSWFEVFIRHFKKIVLITVSVLLGVILLLGWMSAKKVREVVIEEFNQQQLVLARQAASQIENSINILKRELSILSLSPSIQYAEPVFMAKRMEIAFSSVRDEGVLEIRFVEDKKRKAHLVDARGYSIFRSDSYDDLHYLKWAGQKENMGRIMISDVSVLTYGDNDQRLIKKVVVPVWQVSVDEAHPVAANEFSGVLMFIVDVPSLVEKITKDIRSGRTGYAWVIDNKGTFLYHPEAEFTGKNAFEARKEKKPTISFARINEIQKEMMLKGKEGTSWYISGWHLGIEGEITKLIAYTPIMLDKDDTDSIWSVAVVAPITEVEDAIRSVLIRQFLLEGVVVFAILSGGLFIIGIMLRWSSSLSNEVEKKTAELKKSEEQCRLLIENANDIIFTVDRNGIITSMNMAGYSFFKKSREDIMGVNLGELCFNEDSAALQLKVIEKVFDSRISNQITYPTNIDGEEHWISTVFSPLFDEAGKSVAVHGIARDISLIKKKEKEEQMYHAEKLASMGTLAAGVAHEINNPLAIILGFSDLLLEKTMPGSEQYDVLMTIERQAMNARRVVQSLLRFARYSEYKEELIDVNNSVETVINVVKNTLFLNKISLTLQLQDNLPKVKADAAELEQVFLNIINNAIHAIRGGGALTVTTRLLKNEQVEIRFADTGHGIKKEHRTKIFDPLFTTKKVGEGTGLGLSVSYGIVTKYAGTITFETKTKDESEQTGTTFIITLPAVKESE